MRPLGSLKNKTTKTKSMAASSDDNTRDIQIELFLTHIFTTIINFFFSILSFLFWSFFSLSKFVAEVLTYWVRA